MNSDDVQVVFADLQPTLVSESRTMTPQGISTSAAILAKAATILRIPMTFSLVPEGDQKGRPIPELDEFVTTTNAFWRTTASLFLDPATSSAVAATGREILVLAGFTAEVVVLHSALGAIEAGWGSSSSRAEIYSKDPVLGLLRVRNRSKAVQAG